MLILLQLEDIARVDANDLDEKSVQSMQRNVAFNGEQASEIVHPTQVIHSSPTKFQHASCESSLLINS